MSGGPGERAPALPALAAYAVAVGDTAATRQHLTANRVPFTDRGNGDIQVPAGPPWAPR
ncbi:MAG: hypothetical protein M0026_00260 [Nocardiopsaceae bacterium]|nr:hypothetical protein [Nocardiopsaceae bacterium]